jgi:SAM-dependent methyltransferase
MSSYSRMLLNSVALVPGAMSLPPIRSLLRRREAKQGTKSAVYCYGVWLRHLVMAAGCRLDTEPAAVAELGPGDSFGTGLAALLCGAQRYTALDAAPYANPRANAKIFDELVELFRARAPIPNQDEYHAVKPRLEDYAFPHHVLGVARMEQALRPERLERIRRAILGEHADPRAPVVCYRAPWQDAQVIEPASQDLVFSQAVLEHVDALREAYAAMRAWLKPGGYLSHQIDFKSHGYAPTWDGHWRYGDFVWRLVRGPASWFINRQPYSAHRSLLAASGFRIVHEQRARSVPSFARGALARRFRAMPEADRETSGAYLLAVPARA